MVVWTIHRNVLMHGPNPYTYYTVRRNLQMMSFGTILSTRAEAEAYVLQTIKDNNGVANEHTSK